MTSADGSYVGRHPSKVMDRCLPRAPAYRRVIVALPMIARPLTGDVAGMLRDAGIEDLSLLLKLGVKSRTQAVLKGMDLGYLGTQRR